MKMSFPTDVPAYLAWHAKGQRPLSDQGGVRPARHAGLRATLQSTFQAYTGKYTFVCL